MNRCHPSDSLLPTLHRRRFAAVLALGLLAGFAPVMAQQNPLQTIRQFPPAAQRGVMVVSQAPELILNGKADRLSPGARIRSAANMLVLSGALVGQKLVVNYVREPGGYVHEVWILTDAEAALKLPTQQ